MNKYQETFDHVLWEIKMCRRSPEKIEDLTKSLSLFQELVDKATPKKAVWIEDFLRCPSCFNYDSLSDGYGEHHNYCNECGQALDWSKD